jgi:predicted proteasome-type protease
MTYCVAISLDAGLIFASDSRTNAGVDRVSRFSKMRTFVCDGERVIVTLSAGNLSLTQNAIGLLEQRGRTIDGEINMWNATSMYDVAVLVGDVVREVKDRDGPYLLENRIPSNANFLVGGQIKGEVPRLFEVYSDGDFTEATPTPAISRWARASTASRFWTACSSAPLRLSRRQNARSCRSTRRCARISRSGYRSISSFTKRMR